MREHVDEGTCGMGMRKKLLVYTGGVGRGSRDILRRLENHRTNFF